MNISDYLINAVFVLVVLRQARERQLDLRSLVVPLLVVAFVAHIYIHSIPTAGNDLVLVAVLAGVGLVLGVLGGSATHIRIGDDGLPMVRVGWIAGALLIVSQFTLYGDVRRGLRPSWIDAAAPEIAEPLYDFFVAQARNLVARVATGSFRAMMLLELVNDGPVTILLDSRKLF